MRGLRERYVCSKFYFKLGKNVVKAFKMLKSSFWRADNAKNIVSEWFSNISVTTTEDAKHSGHPSVSNTDKNVDRVK